MTEPQQVLWKTGAALESVLCRRDNRYVFLTKIMRRGEDALCNNLILKKNKSSHSFNAKD